MKIINCNVHWTAFKKTRNKINVTFESKMVSSMKFSTSSFIIQTNLFSSFQNSFQCFNPLTKLLKLKRSMNLWYKYFHNFWSKKTFHKFWKLWRIQKNDKNCIVVLNYFIDIAPIISHRYSETFRISGTIHSSFFQLELKIFSKRSLG